MGRELLRARCYLIGTIFLVAALSVFYYLMRHTSFFSKTKILGFVAKLRVSLYEINSRNSAETKKVNETDSVVDLTTTTVKTTLRLASTTALTTNSTKPDSVGFCETNPCNSHPLCEPGYKCVCKAGIGVDCEDVDECSADIGF